MKTNELTESELSSVTGGRRVCVEVENLTVNGDKVGDGKTVVICYDEPKAPPNPGTSPILKSKDRK